MTSQQTSGSCNLNPTALQHCSALISLQPTVPTAQPNGGRLLPVATSGSLGSVMMCSDSPRQALTEWLSLLVCITSLPHFPIAGKPLTKEQLLPEIGAFILAGFDTSSHTIAWCL